MTVALAEGITAEPAPQAAEEEEVEEEIQEVTSRLQADGLLWQIGQLEGELQEVQDLARQEIAQIQQWEEGETRRLQERIHRLSSTLEGFLRRQERKSLRLPHGDLKLRVQSVRITIVDLAAFPLDREELVRIMALLHEGGDFPGCGLETTQAHGLDWEGFPSRIPFVLVAKSRYDEKDSCPSFVQQEDCFW